MWVCVCVCVLCVVCLVVSSVPDNCELFAIPSLSCLLLLEIQYMTIILKLFFLSCQMSLPTTNTLYMYAFTCACMCQCVCVRAYIVYAQC